MERRSFLALVIGAVFAPLYRAPRANAVEQREIVIPTMNSLASWDAPAPPLTITYGHIRSNSSFTLYMPRWGTPELRQLLDERLRDE